jgi:hypothetical protein
VKPGVGPGPLQLGQRRVLIGNERVSGCNGWNGHPGGEVPMVVATRRRTGRVTACYIAGPQDNVDDPMSIGAFRLFNWFDRRNDPGPNGQVCAELPAILVVISSRRTYEHAGHVVCCGPVRGPSHWCKPHPPHLAYPQHKRLDRQPFL